MKKLAIIFLITAILLPQAVLAQGLIKPPSRLYFLQTWGETIKLAFTFNKETKIGYLLELAQRRVEEIQNNPELSGNKIKRLASRYEKHFRQMEGLANEIKEKKQEEAAEKIRERNLAQQRILAEIYQKVPDKARAGISNAQENSAKNVAAVLEKTAGEEAALQFKEQVKQLQQAQIQERARIMPQEGGGPAPQPGQTQFKELKPSQPLQTGKELRQPEPAMETGADGENQVGKPAEPVAPAPQQPQNQ